jgi:ribosome biogenesis GTPase
VNLENIGWNSFFNNSFAPYSQQGYIAGRIAAEHKHIYRVYIEQGELLAAVSGKMRYEASGRRDFPAVGDWVVLSPTGEGKATIQAVLPRQSKFSRQTAGTTVEEQVIAANIDTVFLVAALNNDFNLRRLERYLTLAWESGANPVIILSKADLCNDINQKVLAIENIAPGVPVHVTSSQSGTGITELASHLRKGRTAALLGSSGAGKSTLINCLCGREAQKTAEIRQSDDRGRHTTTYRELIILPGGGLIIDTPGMRELQLWGTCEGLQSFADISLLASQCRFKDCRHEGEPGCAVKAALENGRLDYDRYGNYRKLQKELAYLSRKENRQEYLAEKERWKKIHKQIKNHKKR